MNTFVARRLASGLLVLLGLAAVLFVLQKLSPVDPARTVAGSKASTEQIAQVREDLGFDRPIVVQFGSYLKDLAQFDLGTSIRTKNAVSDDIGATLGPTLELLTAAAVLALVMGAGLGFLAIRSGWGARILRSSTILVASAPSFLLGILLVMLFYSKLGLLPGSGETSVDDAPGGPTGLLLVDSLLHGQIGTAGDALQHLVLPAFTLALAPSVAIGRSFASALTSAVRADYVKTATMKGLTPRHIMVRHVVRNCLNSALAMTGLQMGIMLAGVTIVETVFGWPGVGRYLATSITSNDLSAIMAVALIIGALFIIVNTVVDVVQALADPRISLNA